MARLPGIFQGQSGWSSFQCGSCIFWCLEPTEVLACILVTGQMEGKKRGKERGKKKSEREERGRGGREETGKEERRGEVEREMGYHNPFL